MSNLPNTSSPGLGRSANRTLTPSLITHSRSVSHGAASLSSQHASMSSDGDNTSISSQKTRKRDKIRNFFRLFKHEDKATIQDDPSQTNIRHAKAVSTDITSAVYSLKVSGSGTGSQPVIGMSEARLNAFSENVTKISTGITIPKLDARIESTSQLALCISLLPRNMASSLQREGLESASDRTNEALWTTSSDGTEREWIKAIEQNPIKQEYLCWLGSRIVEEFIKNAVKDPVTVSEVVLLGSVLDQVHYRKLLNCFIAELQGSVLLDVDLLQGLIQLVQCAAPTYLDADDLVKILRILRMRLGDTHQQSLEHQYHLTLAVSRLLDVMAEPEHKVKDLPRVEEREPLASVLSGLQSSSDPYLMYQALYAFQALQYIPDDESALQVIMRHSLGAAESLIKVSGVIQLNFNGLLEGLRQMQKTVEESYGIAKSSYEGISSLIDSGRGLFDSLKNGLVSGHKHPWYPAVLTAIALCRAGQLGDFSKLVREAPCRRDPRFQWGVSQLLGEIAIDDEWQSCIREQAVSFLGDLYLNDADWAQDDSVRSWMLTILGKISEVSESAVRKTAAYFLQESLKDDSAIVRHPYPLRSRLLIPMKSPLLALVQDIPYLEYDLNNLRLRRLQEYSQTVYIPPQAKADLQASDKDALPLMTRVKEFLEGDGQVFLVLGDSGAGKSTFNRHLEHELWNEYKAGGRIPLFINLPAINEPYHDMVDKQLRINKFSDSKINELKEHRQMILICDGYDESLLKINLHTANMFNQNTKMVISCRSTYLGQDYRDQFQPQRNDRYNSTTGNSYMEAAIVPFSGDQIEEYVKQFVRDPEVRNLLGGGPIWTAKDYMDKLKAIPNLMELVKNPFLLLLSLRALPVVVKDAVNLAKVKVTRLRLYDSFIDQWLDINKIRLTNSALPDAAKSELLELREEDFTPMAIEFLKNLAAAIYKEQDGNPVVQYTPKSDKGTWKSTFFGSELGTTLLRESSPLSRAGIQHRFIHRSLLEYFYSRHIYEAIGVQEMRPDGAQPLANDPLSQKNLAKEQPIVQFLAEYVQGDSAYEQRLHRIVEQSKTNVNASRAAANAITILVRAGVLFNGANLQGIQIPGANLSGGQFDSAQLQGADLRGANLRNIWLRRAVLSNALMEDVEFGESAFLEEIHSVLLCAYSQDGKTLALVLINNTISLYDTASWEKTCELPGHTSRVTSVVFSPTGQQIASGSNDWTVRLWDTQTGAPGAILRGHDSWVTSVVFSPSGKQIASGSSDKTVQLWDAQTGAPGATLKGHTERVMSVVFSPNGQRLASGSLDKTVRLWDTQTGGPGVVLCGHTEAIMIVVFSPNGRQIASGSEDNTVRLWDAQTGAPGAILSGHTSRVTRVVFSPNGPQLASGSLDMTVRLWDTQTGGPGAVLCGHTEGVTSVVFSPSGRQIASGSSDNTVRLWDAQTGAPGAILNGHTDWVTSVEFSPTGQQIASSSWDKTVRLWDAQAGASGAISGHTDCVRSMMTSPSGQQIASGSDDGTVRLWDAQTGAPGAILSGHTQGVTSVGFSPSGQHIASGSSDNAVRLWDAQTGAPGAILSGHTSCVMSVAFSPNGQQIVSGSGSSTDGERGTRWRLGSRDYTVRLWDAQTGVPGAILSGHTARVMSVVFSPNGQQIASGSDDETVLLWNARTGAPGAALRGHTKGVTSVAFSPSGQQIASGSFDTTVRLWDAQTGLPGAILSGHTGCTRSVVYSPDGRNIASGSDDNTMRLWDVKTGHCLSTIKDFHEGIYTVAWNADVNGSYLTTGCGDKSVRLWKVVGACSSVHLLWSSRHDQLVVSDANISYAQGLSRLNMKLLEQRGAVSTLTS